MMIENITIQIKAEFPQKRQKGQNITKPTVSKPFCGSLKSQNQSYPVTQNYKTNSFVNKIFKNTLFTKPIIANTQPKKAGPHLRPASAASASAFVFINRLFSLGSRSSYTSSGTKVITNSRVSVVSLPVYGEGDYEGRVGINISLANSPQTVLRPASGARPAVL